MNNLRHPFTGTLLPPSLQYLLKLSSVFWVHYIFCCTANCIPLLIQQNAEGSYFFNRSWAKFKVGFNDTRGNYWLGNELLHQLTDKKPYKLRFDLQAFNGSWYYAYIARSLYPARQRITRYWFLGTR